LTRIRLLGAALAGAAVALSACGGADDAAPAAEDEATLDAGTGAADMSPTLEGSGDMSSAAGAGAATAAMDGGRAGDDGTPPVEEGEGGPSDALDEVQRPAE
jgi:hypothetical protein